MEKQIDFDYLRYLPLKNRAEYCKSILDEKIGEGSSRIVFRYGPDKIIKIPKGKRGIAQNLGEIQQYKKLTNPTALLAKIYDCDDTNWSYVISEYVNCLSKEEFLLKTGYNNSFKFRNAILKYLKHDILPDNKLVADFCVRIKNSGVEIKHDFMRRDNIGIRNTANGEEIVVIDCGVNQWMGDYLYLLDKDKKSVLFFGSLMAFIVAAITIVTLPLSYPLIRLYKRISNKM